MKTYSNRERFVRTVQCKQVDRLPFCFLFGPWGETVDRWKREGMPADRAWDEYFGMDAGVWAVPANYGFCPEFETKVLENRGDTSIIITPLGVKQEVSNLIATIPRDIEHPVTDMKSWEGLKNRLDPRKSARFPADLDRQMAEARERDQLVQVGNYPWGLFGTLRELLGVTEFLIDFYEDPELIRTMMDDFTDFWIEIHTEIARHGQIDIVHIWEDMSGKTGSMISPAMVEEFMLPNYRKIKTFCDENKIPIFAVDTDGDAEQLMPLFNSAGVNLMYPCEVQAGSDVVKYRSKYPGLALSGGIDKMAIARGRDEIDRELERVRPLLRTTGYIPAPDHLIPPEISFENFCYFASRLREELGE